MPAPSEKEWAALYEAAIAFIKASPWEWMEDVDMFAVVNPANGEPGYCSILGHGRQQFGLGVFVGHEGLSGYAKLLSDSLGPDDDSNAMTPLLSMLLAERNDLHEKDREIIRSLGLAFRGKNAWPLFRSQKPGYLPWYLEEEEALFLTVAIQQALKVAEKVREGKLDLLMRGENFVFARHLAGGTWRGEWRRLEKPHSNTHLRAEPLGAVDEARVHLLGCREGRLSGIWELDLFPLPAPVRAVSGRPYFPLCFLTVDGEQGLIVDCGVSEPWINLAEKRDKVIQILEKTRRLPSEVWVKSQAIRQILEPVTEHLGIKIRVRRLSALEEAKADLTGYLFR